jgi:hypothetical protein
LRLLLGLQAGDTPKKFNDLDWSTREDGISERARAIVIFPWHRRRPCLDDRCYYCISTWRIALAAFIARE